MLYKLSKNKLISKPFLSHKQLFSWVGIQTLKSLYPVKYKKQNKMQRQITARPNNLTYYNTRKLGNWKTLKSRLVTQVSLNNMDNFLSKTLVIMNLYRLKLFTVFFTNLKHQTLKHQTLKHQTLKHQTLKHQTLKHQTLKHQTLKHQTLKHQTLKHQTLKHQTLKHQTLKHQTLSKPFCPYYYDYIFYYTYRREFTLQYPYSVRYILTMAGSFSNDYYRSVGSMGGRANWYKWAVHIVNLTKKNFLSGTTTNLLIPGFSFRKNLRLTPLSNFITFSNMKLVNLSTNLIKFPTLRGFKFFKRLKSQQKYVKKKQLNRKLTQNYMHFILKLLKYSTLKIKIFTWYLKNYKIYKKWMRGTSFTVKKINYLSKYTFFKLKTLSKNFNRIKFKYLNKLRKIKRIRRRLKRLTKRVKNLHIKLYTLKIYKKFKRRMYMSKWNNRLIAYKKLNQLGITTKSIYNIGTLLTVNTLKVIPKLIKVKNYNLTYWTNPGVGYLANYKKNFSVLLHLNSINICKYLLFKPLLLKALLVQTNIIVLLQSLTHWISTKLRMNTNLMPSTKFKLNLSMKLFGLAGHGNFRKLIASWYEQTLVRFMQYIFGVRALFQYFPGLDKVVKNSFILRYRSWMLRMNYYERRLGHKFFLEEGLHIIHISFVEKDVKLLHTWLATIIKRISFWKTRLIFRFIKYLFLNRFQVIYPILDIKGFKVKLKGKISVAGNSRKRTILFRCGKNSHSTVDLRVLHHKGTIVTFTGVMGFQVWIFY